MNRVEVSVKVDNLLKALKESVYKENQILEDVIKYRNGEYIDFWSDVNILARETTEYNLFEITDMLRGLYDVKKDKNAIVLSEYRFNTEICRTSEKPKELWKARGFNEGVKFINDLYKLGIKLEGE